MEIDYAFYCQDGVYNMGMEEAAECARLVNAKKKINHIDFCEKETKPFE